MLIRLIRALRPTPPPSKPVEDPEADRVSTHLNQNLGYLRRHYQYARDQQQSIEGARTKLRAAGRELRERAKHIKSLHGAVVEHRAKIKQASVSLQRKKQAVEARERTIETEALEIRRRFECLGALDPEQKNQLLDLEAWHEQLAQWQARLTEQSRQQIDRERDLDQTRSCLQDCLKNLADLEVRLQLERDRLAGRRQRLRRYRHLIAQPRRPRISPFKVTKAGPGGLGSPTPGPAPVRRTA